MRGGTNLVKVKDYNEQVVLETIREKTEISRVEVARKTGLSPQTVSNIVGRLLDYGLVKESGKGPSNGKRPRVLLKIDASAGYAVGVQIDNDETTLVLVNLSGQVVARTRCTTLREDGTRTLIDGIARSVNELLEMIPIDRQRVIGVGVASPGPLDFNKGIVFNPVFNPPPLPEWREVHLKEELENKIGYPVIVDRDATAAAIGERWAGGAQGVHSFALVFMHPTGVGAGFFLEDRVYRGVATMAGAIGHTTLEPDGLQCFCGNRGCLELYCSPQAVCLSTKERLKRGEKSSLGTLFEENVEHLTFDAIRQAGLQGDVLALQELRKSGRLLGIGIANMVNTMDVELIVLGGKSFQDVGHIYQQEVEKLLNERMIASEWRRTSVQLSMATEDAGAVGAASLILHSAYAPQMRTL